MSHVHITDFQAPLEFSSSLWTSDTQYQKIAKKARQSRTLRYKLCEQEKHYTEISSNVAALKLLGILDPCEEKPRGETKGEFRAL